MKDYEEKFDYETDVKYIKDVVVSKDTVKRIHRPNYIMEFYGVEFVRKVKKGNEPVLSGMEMVLSKGNIYALASLRATDFSPVVGMLMRGYPYPEYMMMAGEVWLNGRNLTRLERMEASELLAGSLVIAGPASRFPSATSKGEMKKTVIDLMTRQKYDYDADAFKENLSALGFGDIQELYNKSYANVTEDEKQRLKLAQVLASGGEVLVLVDPTMNLLRESKYHLQVLLEEKLAAGKFKTALILTEDIEFAGDTASYLNILDLGVVVERGTREQIVSNTTNELIRSMLTNI